MPLLQVTFPEQSDFDFYNSYLSIVETRFHSPSTDLQIHSCMNNSSTSTHLFINCLHHQLQAKAKLAYQGRQLVTEERKKF